MAPRALGEGGAVRTARGRNVGEEHGAWGQAGPRSRGLGRSRPLPCSPFLSEEILVDSWPFVGRTDSLNRDMYVKCLAHSRCSVSINMESGQKSDYPGS